VSDAKDVRRQAGWLPPQDDLEQWLEERQERVEAERDDVELHPTVVELQELLASDPLLRMYVDRMLTEEPKGKPYSKRHIQDPAQLLRLVNQVLTTAPEFSEQAMVATPLNAILDWPMGTTAGFAAFRDPRFNAAIKKILNAWCTFLDSPDSRYVLTDAEGGWMSEAARNAIGIERFEHDPDAEHWGFESWNAFFTRRFKEGERPVAEPDDDTVVVSPCESSPYAIGRDVQREDSFWIKSQPYSLQDLLAQDPSVEEFVGGTIWQAYLSATSYHRWHSPVAGRVVRAFNVDGTYYSEADTEGAGATEPSNSQGYMAHVATRAVILIEADNAEIGLVAFVPIGMSDVSSCLIHPHLQPGYHLAKGEELGYFQFGGSTVCVVFRPGVVEGFTLEAIPQPDDPAAPSPPVVQVRSSIATTR